MSMNAETQTIDRDKLFEVARQFRATLCPIARGSMLRGRNRSFPDGFCEEASLMLGRFLQEQFQLDPQLVRSKWFADRYYYHVWLLVDGYTVDITADQFGQEEVIVCTVSDWHENLPPKQTERLVYDTHLWAQWCAEIYSMVVSELTDT